MTKTLFIFLCIVVFTSCSTYHIYTKEEAIKVAKKRDIKKDGSIIIEDDKRIFKVLTRDSSYQKLDEIYEFSDDGKQLKYSIIASCDTCFQKYFLKEMNNDSYKWRKLNDSTYVSKYSLKSFLNVHKSTYSFDIVHQHNLSKKDYENLMKNTENWLFAFNFIKCILMELRLPARGFSTSHHRQYLFVSCNILCKVRFKI